MFVLLWKNLQLRNNDTYELLQLPGWTCIYWLDQLFRVLMYLFRNFWNSYLLFRHLWRLHLNWLYIWIFILLWPLLSLFSLFVLLRWLNLFWILSSFILICKISEIIKITNGCWHSIRLTWILFNFSICSSFYLLWLIEILRLVNIKKVIIDIDMISTAPFEFCLMIILTVDFGNDLFHLGC